jgi:hypothetical protein
MAYNPYATTSGNDPRGQLQNQAGYQQNRYEQQQGPMANLFGYNAGRASETDFNDRNDIMNRYRAVAGGEGGGDEGGYDTWGPSKISYTDPFKSYGGYEEFSKTGGYSTDDIANMRSRGTSPIRAAYANAGREVNRQRALQGGYAPNAFASQVKMAREQGQATADAQQNVEAGLAEARNKGRLAGLGGMYGVEGQRLGADLEVGKFNAMAEMNAAQSNAGAANAARAQGKANQLGALSGMTSLYGTTPGMSGKFGDQLLGAVGQGGTYGLGMMGERRLGQALPGQFEQTNQRINQGMQTGRDIYSTASTVAYPWLQQMRKKPAGGTQQPSVFGRGGAAPSDTGGQY